MIAEIMSAIEPIVKTMTVGSDAAETFKFFTGQFGTWWPVNDPKYTGKDAASVHMETRNGGRIYATFKDGSDRTWGIIQEYEPGQRLSFSWGAPVTVEGEKDGVTEVSVDFVDGGDGTCTLTLTHSGWERLASEAQETRNDYDEGWDHVIGECFADFARDDA